MLVASSKEVTPNQSPAISPKVSPRPGQLQEKLITISKLKFQEYLFWLMI